MKAVEIEKLGYQGADNSACVYWEPSLPGFGVRVYPTGHKAYVVKARQGGRQHYVTLGPVGGLSPLEARSAAKRLLAEFALSGVGNYRSCKFSELADLYIERHAKVHKKSWREDERRIKKYLLPRWEHLTLEAIQRPEVARLHLELGREMPYQANRVLENISKMFQLAVIWGLLPDGHHNPTVGIQTFKEAKRDRFVTEEEMPRLMATIGQEAPEIRGAIMLYLLAGWRKQELLGLRWSDIDFARKEIRIAETKSGRIHYLPLTEAIRQVMDTLPREEGNPWVIIGRDRGKHRVSLEKAWQRVRSAAGLDDVRLHDLRRTCGSWLAHSGHGLPLIGAVLNQTCQTVTATYSRFKRDDVREALEAHGAKIISFAEASKEQEGA